MSEYKELYLPLFYNWYELTEELTNEEFGELIRTLLLNARENKSAENLKGASKMAYNFMLDAAKRTNRNQEQLSEKRREAANKRWSSEKCKSMQNDANECTSMHIKEEEKENNKEDVKEKENRYSHSRARRETKKESLGNFDTDYAFMKAIERTYGSLDDDDDD